MFPVYRQGEDLHEQKGYCWGHVKTDDTDTDRNPGVVVICYQAS